MWKKNSRVACVLLLAMLLLSALLPATALAIDPIDTSRKCTIEAWFGTNLDDELIGKIEDTNDYKDIYNNHLGKPLMGMEINLYQVAEINDPNSFTHFVLLPEFAGSDTAKEIAKNKVDSKSAWKDAAQELADWVEAYAIDTVNPERFPMKVGSSGSLIISKLNPGLYLLVGEPMVYGEYYYSMGPILVAVPGREPDEHEWDYTVTVIGKCDRVPHLIDLTVRKKWDDGNSSSRPSSIKVKLTGDGRTRTVTLSKANNWTYTWKDLPASAVSWKVEEVVPENYTAKIGKIEKIGTDQFEISIKNTRKTTTDSTLPQTGLNWWPVAALAVSGMVLVFLGWLARRADEESEEA